MKDGEKFYLFCLRCKKFVAENDAAIIEIKHNGADMISFVCPGCGHEGQSLRADAEVAGHKEE